MNTVHQKTEERLSRISAQLDSIMELLMPPNEKIADMIIELRQEIEEIYISLENSNYDTY